MTQRPEVVLGMRVREYREAERWSQEQLAEMMFIRGFDWSQAIVTRTERAARPIRVNEAVELAMIFNVTVDQLIATKRDPEQESAMHLRYRALSRQIEVISSQLNLLMDERADLRKHLNLTDTR